MKKLLAVTIGFLLVSIILYGCTSTEGKNLPKQDTTNVTQKTSSTTDKNSEVPASDKNQHPLEIYDAVDKSVADFLNK